MKKIIHKIFTLLVLLTGLTNVTSADPTDQEFLAEVEHNKYAVIINAESNGEHNYIRYWNDCSAMYKTLLRHGFQSSNIYVAMSDGTDSHDDIMLENSNYESSPLDLDGDSYYDIRFAATRDDIESIFYDTLSNKITEDDDLFIYTVGEGYVERLHFSYLNHPDPQYPLDPDSMSIYDPHYISSLVLWGGYHLMDISFARMLAHIQARTINIVMQQSHSGGFIDALREMDNVVITTACGVNEKSYSMENQLYDEFTYHWITAVNGKTPPTIDSVNVPTIFFADGNQDGFITMDEAYLYAADLDDSDENPQMESHPECLGHALALDALSDCLPIPGWDLYIKDDDRDYGDEPNLITPYPWICADIWYEEDGQKIEILQSGETYDVCVKVRNRGEEISPGNATLYVHWTKATIGSTWPWGWYSQYTYDCNGTSVRRGDMIGSIVLPPIAGGESYVARIPWTTPDVEEYSPCLEFAGDNYAELWHYCMLARIVDEQEQPDETITNLGLAEFVLNHNNVVSRNLTIMNTQNNGSTSPYPPGIVGISSPRAGEECGPYTLSCHISGDAGWEQMTTVNLSFAPQFISSQPSMTYSHCQAINSNSFELEDGAQFEEIYFSGSDIGSYPIILEIDNSDIYDVYPRFKVDLVLLDDQGNIINGETFLYKNDRPDLANVIRRPPYMEEPENEMEQQSVLLEDGLTIDVYNAQGMHLKHCDNCDIPSLNLPKGIYIYRMQSENQSYTKKVIK